MATVRHEYLRSYGWVRAVSSDGTVMVEVITRSCSNYRDGGWLRIRRRGIHYSDVRSVPELVRQLAGLGLDLADLTEAD